MNLNPRVETLRSLVQLDYDAAESYAVALQRVTSNEVAHRLREFGVDHLRHVQDLGALIQTLGGEPAEPVPHGFTATLGARGDEAVLAAMARHEAITNSTYRDVLDLDWSPRERVVLARNLADEQRHLAWIRGALQRRVWEGGEARL